MKVKGKKIIDSEKAAEFANTIRGQYIISQALSIASEHLSKLEDRDEPYPKKGEHAQPSNNADMKYLLKAYPLYKIHEYKWEEDVHQTHEYIINKNEGDNTNGI